MSKKVEVKKTEVVSVKLRVKGKEIDLSLEEAKELKDELTKLFAEPVKEYVPYPSPYIPYVPYEPYKPYEPYVPYEPYKPYEPYVQPYWGSGTGDMPAKLPYIYCSPNMTSGTITIGDSLPMPETTMNAYENLVNQVCNTMPTTATCGSMGFSVINVGGGYDLP
jgi:hypothetical protein